MDKYNKKKAKILRQTRDTITLYNNLYKMHVFI